jgi:hypothetical protein
MKPLRFVLLALSMSLPAMANAQSDAHAMPAASDKATPSDSQKAFDTLKTLAGSWVGRLTTFPAAPEVDGNFAQFSLRVGSLGNSFVHEMSISGRPDHPVTMFYRDADRLLLTHYCDAGNRPRMVATLSPDGKTLDFEFLDLAGGDEYGHMHHATFTFIDENHHTEDWTYMVPGDKPVRAHFELQRTNAGTPTT